MVYRMEALLALLETLTPAQREVVEKAASQIKRLEIEVEHQRLVILELRRSRYGAKGEKLSSLQLDLLDLEPGVSVKEVESEAGQAEPQLSEDAPGEDSAITKTTPKKRYGKPHLGRRPLPAHLPRVERVLECTPDECRCGQCGKDKKLIGWDVTETLDLKPLEFFVVQTKRAKYACPACPDEGVQQPSVPARIIDRGMCEDRVVIEVLVRKYTDHMPLYRQAAAFLRDADIDLSRKTLMGWVMRAGELLVPVNAAIFAEVAAEGYMQVDESPVPVSDPDTPGGNARGWWWTYSNPRGSVSYGFARTRGYDAAVERLKGYIGRMQTDGYAVYDKFHHEGLIHLGCWSHARRPFHQLATVLKQDAPKSAICRHAIGIVEAIGKLYSHESVLREANAPPEVRLAHRLEHSMPLLDPIKEKIERAQAHSMPSSKLGKACAYVLGQWPKLIRIFEFGDVELDTNWAENSVRPLVLGRKNWMHVGSWEAGPRVAAIASVIESSKRLGINPRDYLADVLPRLASGKMSEVPALTPAAWLRHRSGPPAA
jgi:transposase